MKDRREYVRIAVDLPENPKLIDADVQSKWLYVVALCYAGRHLTDGHFPSKIVQKNSGIPQKFLIALATRNVIHFAGHDCKDCEQPAPDWAVIHDYLEHQRSRAEAADSRSGMRRGAELTNHKRWHAEPDPTCRLCRRPTDRPSDTEGDTTPHRPSDRPRVAEVEVEVEGEVVVDVVSHSPTVTREANSRRPDFNAIAKALGSDIVWAMRVSEQVLSLAAGPVTRPTSYILEAIHRNPDNYRPTRTPPRLGDLCPEHQRDRATCPPTWHQEQP